MSVLQPMIITQPGKHKRQQWSGRQM